MRFTGGSQASNEYTNVTNKKRKLGTLGRPIGAVNKAKTTVKDADTRTLNFFPQIDQRRFGETPASTQLSESSDMDIEPTPSD
jgi:hypothetical protein